MTAKRYQRIKQNLEFIFSDIADLNNDAVFYDKNFKNVSLQDIEYCLYLSKNNHLNFQQNCIDYLNRTHFIIMGLSADKVLSLYNVTDKFKTYKF